MTRSSSRSSARALRRRTCPHGYEDRGPYRLAARARVPAGTLSWSFDGLMLSGDQTPADVGLDHGDTIEYYHGLIAFSVVNALGHAALSTETFFRNKTSTKLCYVFEERGSGAELGS